MRFLLFFSLLLSEAACWTNGPSNQVPFPFVSDTTLVAKYTDAFILDQNMEMRKAKLKLNTNFQFNPFKKYVLKIDAVLPHLLPEGAYTAFLSVEKMEASIPAENDLLGLIDFYGLDVNHPTSLSWDVTEHLSTIFSGARMPSPVLEFSVYFQGNVLPDGNPVKHQGKLELKNISLLEIKE